MIPPLIVTAAFLPRSNRGGFAVALIERFELKGASAAAVERVFAQPASVRDTLSVLGALLVVSGLSFCRALQRLYERTWRAGVRPRALTPAHLRWIAVVIAYVAVMGAVNAVRSEWFDTGAKVAIGLAGGFLAVALDAVPAARAPRGAAGAALGPRC